jgi:hypothetical protein
MLATRKRKSWEPSKYEVVPPPLHIVTTKECSEKGMKESKLELLRAEQEIIEITRHDESIDLSSVVENFTKYPSSDMKIFRDLMRECKEMDSFDFLKGYFGFDEYVHTISFLFGLLGTAPKKKITEFVRDSELQFRLVGMSSCFQFFIRNEEYTCDFIDMSKVVGFDALAEAQIFICNNSSIPSVVSIIYSGRVDMELWRCEYPKEEITNVLYTCNKMATECTYNFEDKRDQFLLSQTLNAYIACIEVMKKLKRDVNVIALQRAMGLDLWMLGQNNSNVFKEIRKIWYMYHNSLFP